MSESTRSRETAFLRIWQIVGDPKASPPVAPLIPIGKSSWWQKVRAGEAPAPIKLGKRVTVWRSADIEAFIETLSQSGGK